MSATTKAQPQREVQINTGIPLPLERFYHWEKHSPTKICFTQPMGNESIQDITWQEAGKQIRSMATYLQKIGVKPGDNVALVSKNCAHWIMADLAIWMAGAVSVPLYPTLTAESVRQIMDHSEARFLFVGKLDDWPAMSPGVPEGVACISFPLSPDNEFPTWDEIVESTEPMKESPSRSHLHDPYGSSKDHKYHNVYQTRAFHRRRQVVKHDDIHFDSWQNPSRRSLNEVCQLSLLH